MELIINLEIEAAIEKALTQDVLAPIVEKAVTAAVKDAVEDATGYRSEFREAMKKQLAEALPHGLGVDDVAKFQHVLNAALTSIVQGDNNYTVKTAMDRAVKSVMPDVPERIKLSEFIAEARQGLHKDEHEPFYAYYEASEYGGGWLYLDDNENPGSSYFSSSHKDREDQKYSADIRLAINKQGEVYSLKLDGVDVTPAKLPNAVGHFDGLLLSMYVGRTSIELDIDDDEVRSLSAEQYE